MKYEFGNIKEFNYKLNCENNDDKTGLLKFSQCDEKYPLHELQKEELKAFISFAKIFESPDDNAENKKTKRFVAKKKNIHKSI